MITEIWKDIVYEGVTYENYQVSNWGRVKSLNYRNTGRAEVMEPSEVKGYLQVDLRKDRKEKFLLVHRLVATAFLPNPDNKPEVNHIDEDKTNNSVENLEWVWHIDNCNHGTRNERIGKTSTNGIRSKRVLQLTLDGEFVREWPSTKECGRNGFHQCAVASCCNGKRKSHKGFRWQYEGR